MLYRLAKHLGSMQLAAESNFPSAAADPADAVEDTHVLDGALVAAAIASIWILLTSVRSGLSDSPYWALVMYAPLILVALIGALLARQPAPLKWIGAHVAIYLGFSSLMGVLWALFARGSAGVISVGEFLTSAAFIAVAGLVTALLCTLAWAAVMHEMSAPKSWLAQHAPDLRLFCVFLILAAALVGAYRAFVLPLA